jgi:hypothetical protein
MNIEEYRSPGRNLNTKVEKVTSNLVESNIRNSEANKKSTITSDKE